MRCRNRSSSAGLEALEASLVTHTSLKGESGLAGGV